MVYLTGLLFSGFLPLEVVLYMTKITQNTVNELLYNNVDEDIPPALYLKTISWEELPLSSILLQLPA